MSRDHAKQLIIDGTPITYLGERVMLVERHNDITGESKWRVECPAEKLRLPSAESPTQAEAMWHSVMNSRIKG